MSPNEAMVKTHIATAIKKGVANELIVQTKGTGASGSFKLAKVRNEALVTVVSRHDSSNLKID